MASPLPFRLWLFDLQGVLQATSEKDAQISRHLLQQLQQQGIAWGWLSDQPGVQSLALLETLAQNGLQPRAGVAGTVAWPAPHSCWQALQQAQAESCRQTLVISATPLLSQSARAAGLWCIGLARHAQANRHWLSLDKQRQHDRRSQATLAHYAAGCHSVVEQLADLPGSLHDLAQRLQRGEQP